jgi:hypothetical protein
MWNASPQSHLDLIPDFADRCRLGIPHVVWVNGSLQIEFMLKIIPPIANRASRRNIVNVVM